MERENRNLTKYLQCLCVYTNHVTYIMAATTKSLRSSAIGGQGMITAQRTSSGATEGQGHVRMGSVFISYMGHMMCHVV